MPRIPLCWKELGALGQLPGPAALPWPLPGIPHLQFYPVIIPSQPLSDVSWSHLGREARTGLGVHGKLSTPSGSAELCRQLGQCWEFWHLPPELGHCRTSLRSPAHEEGHFNQEESTLIPPGPQLLVLRAAGDVSFPAQLLLQLLVSSLDWRLSARGSASSNSWGSTFTESQDP